MPPITYAIALDKNADGYVNMDSGANDPPNILPTPVTFASLDITQDGANTTIRSTREEFAYGIYYYQCLFLSTTAGKFIVGALDWATPVIDTIPVTVGQTYTAIVWMRGESGYAGAPLNFTIYDQTKTQIATQALTLTDPWEQKTLTFTPTVGVTHVALSIDRGAGPVNVIVHSAGYMLVEGSSAPIAFNSGDDLDDFITDDVLAIHWRTGMNTPYERIAQPIDGTISVNNTDKRYSPESGLLNITPGTKVRVRATHDSDTHTLFTGFVDHIQPQTGTQGERLATLHLAGADQALYQARVLAPLQVNTSANTVIEVILSNSVFSERAVQDFDAGISQFAHVGDTWRDGVLAITPIRDVVEAEQGRFYVDRPGRFAFRNRLFKTKVITPVATLTDNFTALDYVYGAGVVNEVRVGVNPRAIGTAGTTLWTLRTAQLVSPGIGGYTRFTARLRDANDRAVGAVTLITPVATTDYVANTKKDGTGTNVTAYVTVAVIATHGSAVTLEFRSTYTDDVYVLAGATLRGTPLIQGDPMVVQQTDLEAISLYGLHTLALELPFLVTIAEAENIARYELERRKNPNGEINGITLDAQDHPTTVLANGLFDQITVSEAQTAHTAPYFIIGEQHRIDLGGSRHQVEWTLEPANPGAYWLLNSSQLNTSTRLGYSY
ncbi:MAG: carbohydrate binding domain-containing protein [Aggregatilineales bacterium]